MEGAIAGGGEWSRMEGEGERSLVTGSGLRWMGEIAG